MQADERKGQCDVCGKRPRVIRQINSGHWMCRKCLEAIHGGPRATTRQLDYLRDLRLDVSRVGTMDEASELIETHKAISHQCGSIFCDLYGASVRDFGIGREDCRQFVAHLIMDEPDFARRVLATEYDDSRERYSDGVFPTEPAWRQLAERIVKHFGPRVAAQPGQWRDEIPDGISVQYREYHWS